MNSRPKIKPELTKVDKFLEYAGWFVLLVIWVLTLVNYNKLPGIIPVHFNFLGEADRFGNKLNIFILPVTATVLFIGLTILNNYPHIFNYPVRITGENALRQYTNATRFIRYLKLALAIIFLLVLLVTFYQSQEFGIWLLILIAVAVFIPLVYFVWRSMKLK